MLKKLLLALALLGLPAVALAGDTFTPNLGLDKPALGSINWGPKINSNSDLLDAAVASKCSIFGCTITGTLVVSSSVFITGPVSLSSNVVVGGYVQASTFNAVGSAYEIEGVIFLDHNRNLYVVNATANSVAVNGNETIFGSMTITSNALIAATITDGGVNSTGLSVTAIRIGVLGVSTIGGGGIGIEGNIEGPNGSALTGVVSGVDSSGLTLAATSVPSLTKPIITAFDDGGTVRTGDMVLINANSNGAGSFTGNLINLEVNNVSQFRADQGGHVFGSTFTATKAFDVAGTTITDHSADFDYTAVAGSTHPFNVRNASTIFLRASEGAGGSAVIPSSITLTSPANSIDTGNIDIRAGGRSTQGGFGAKGGDLRLVAGQAWTGTDGIDGASILLEGAGHDIGSAQSDASNVVIKSGPWHDFTCPFVDASSITINGPYGGSCTGGDIAVRTGGFGLTAGRIFMTVGINEGVKFNLNRTTIDMFTPDSAYYGSYIQQIGGSGFGGGIVHIYGGSGTGIGVPPHGPGGDPVGGFGDSGEVSVYGDSVGGPGPNDPTGAIDADGRPLQDSVQILAANQAGGSVYLHGGSNGFNVGGSIVLQSGIPVATPSNSFHGTSTGTIRMYWGSTETAKIDDDTLWAEGVGNSTYSVKVSSSMKFLTPRTGIVWADGSVSTTAFSGSGGGGGSGVCNAGAGANSVLCQGLGNTASALDSTVSGGSNNSANNNNATVGGGDSNSAFGLFSTVGGGDTNTAGPGNWSTVGGGTNNQATGARATVAGGEINTASGASGFVGGGANNIASGSYAAVAGGVGNEASGLASFAGGQHAKASAQGSFVWADSVGGNLLGSTTDQFLVRAQGGFFVRSTSATFTNPGGAFSMYMNIGSGQLGIFEIDGSNPGLQFIFDDNSYSGLLNMPLAGGRIKIATFDIPRILVEDNNTEVTNPMSMDGPVTIFSTVTLNWSTLGAGTTVLDATNGVVVASTFNAVGSAYQVDGITVIDHNRNFFPASLTIPPGGAIVADSATLIATGGSVYDLTLSTSIRFLNANTGIRWADGSVSTTAASGTGGGGGGGTVTGTGANSRVAFWDSTSNLNSNSSFTWNGTGLVLASGLSAGTTVLDATHGVVVASTFNAVGSAYMVDGITVIDSGRNIFANTIVSGAPVDVQHTGGFLDSPFLLRVGTATNANMLYISSTGAFQLGNVDTVYSTNSAVSIVTGNDALNMTIAAGVAYDGSNGAACPGCGGVPDGVGGQLTLKAGKAVGNGSFAAVSNIHGETYSGGRLDITGGEGSGIGPSNGGPVNITGGKANSPSTNSNGGPVDIYGGLGRADGGRVNIVGGTGTLGSGGDVVIVPGGGGSGFPGSIKLNGTFNTQLLYDGHLVYNFQGSDPAQVTINGVTGTNPVTGLDEDYVLVVATGDPSNFLPPNTRTWALSVSTGAHVGVGPVDTNATLARFSVSGANLAQGSPVADFFNPSGSSLLTVRGTTGNQMGVIFSTSTKLPVDMNSGFAMTYKPGTPKGDIDLGFSDGSVPRVEFIENPGSQIVLFSDKNNGGAEAVVVSTFAVVVGTSTGVNTNDQAVLKVQGDSSQGVIADFVGRTGSFGFAGVNVRNDNPTGVAGILISTMTVPLPASGDFTGAVVNYDPQGSGGGTQGAMTVGLIGSGSEPTIKFKYSDGSLNLQGGGSVNIFSTGTGDVTVDAAGNHITVTNANTATGHALCINASNRLSNCTSVVAADGSCTCP